MTLRALVALGLVLGATSAWAQNATAPTRVRVQRGTDLTISGVTCTTAGTVTALSATEDDNASSVILKNNEASGGNNVMICTSTPCDSSTATNGFTLTPQTSLQLTETPKGPLYCDGMVGSVVLQRVLENWQ